MDDKNFYWLRLLKFWVKTKGRNGLSIPFILGAGTLTKDISKINENSVSDLLYEIRDSSCEEVFTLQRCEDIGEYVLGLDDLKNPKVGLKILNAKTQKVSMIATLDTTVLGKTFEQIATSLNNRYNECLSKANFSRMDYKWMPFSISDLELIHEALNE